MNYRPLYLFSLLALLLAGCDSEQQERQQDIIAQEQATDAETNAENTQALIALYEAYLNDYPEDADNNPKYLYRKASLHYRMGDQAVATDLLQQALEQYPDSEVAPKVAYMLGGIYEEKLRDAASAQTVYQAMQQAYPEAKEAKKAAKQLPAGLQPLPGRLEELRQSIYKEGEAGINYRMANAYLNSAELHALLLPEEPNTPELLYRAGEIARAVRSFERAIALYQQLSEQHSSHEYASKALFMQAFTYDDDLNEYGRARALYEQFLERYPEDDFADDAQVLLDNLGKNEQEIIEQLTQPVSE